MTNKIINLQIPTNANALASLNAGDHVLLSGYMYTGRDAAHKRIFTALKNGDKLPFELKDSCIYYVGPCIFEGRVTSAGPTTSMRMDAYAPALYDAGMTITIGKGDRSEEVYGAIKRNGGVYLAAIGGAGAICANAIESFEVVAYPDLGTEAVRKYIVKDFPVIVAIDSRGNTVFKKDQLS